MDALFGAVVQRNLAALTKKPCQDMMLMKSAAENFIEISGRGGYLLIASHGIL